MYGIQQLQAGQQQADDALDKGQADAEAQLGKASGLFGDLAANYAGGSKLYLDASGANGADAANAARSAFTTSPAYGFNLDQTLQGLSRARAVNGTLASGNADFDAMKAASGLASQEYGNWLGNLGNIDTKHAAAVSNQAGTFGDLGRLAYGTGTAKANLAAQTGNNIAQVGTAGMQAGQQARANGWNAIIGVANAGAKLAGSAMGGGYSIFGGK